MSVLVRALYEGLATFVSPHRCAACDASVSWATAFCPPCAATLVRATPVDSSRVAIFSYGGAIAEALRRFKFEDRPDLAAALLAGVTRALPQLASLGSDLVVPVPLHPARLVERGYNQAALLARPLARRLHVPWAPRALGRVAATQRQTDLSREARARNVDRAFVPRDLRALLGKSVLLVDDVETTGATLEACRRAALAGGARSVASVVIARVEF